MKKLISLLSCALLLLSLASCSPAPASAAPETTAATLAPVVETISIELVAGEAGEYGELITLNEGTEFAETYYVYRVPAGTYTVTNTGEYMSQFNVYGDTVYVTEEGWEELSDTVYVKLLDVGQSDTVQIAEGQIIEIHEPDHFALVPAE